MLIILCGTQDYYVGNDSAQALRGDDSDLTPPTPFIPGNEVFDVT